MLLFNNLNSARTLKDVAGLLGFKASALAYVLYKKSPSEKYRAFEIPKRHGGTRKILAPTAELKLIQRRLSDLLQRHATETDAHSGSKNQISHGFEPGKSITTNAACHRNRRYVFNVDIKDFFGSINFGRIRGLLIKDKNFALTENVATIIAQIACHENSLPQGSPCSPVISNLIAHVLDIHLVKLAARNGCRYTRYADDLTFSTNQKKFPSSIAKTTGENNNEWLPGSELTRLVQHSGFELNPKKTRMQYRDSRQEVTGLIVNRKINVRSEYRRKVRAMVHRLFSTGKFDFEENITTEKGTPTKKITPGNLNQLHGMLGFIHEIDAYNREHAEPQELTGKDKKSLNKSKDLIYRRFLLFKEFHANEKPVILCEGKTDNIYLLHAIRRLAPSFPQLATIEKNGDIKLKIKIFKYSDTSTGKILGITGGAPCLKNFINLYRAETKKFTSPGKIHPVILLVDNDSGSNEIYSTLKQIVKPEPKRTDRFVHAFGNLYILPTPLPSGKEKSMIEDFFDDDTKKTIISGKTFSTDENADKEKYYGKVIFAHKVIRANADSINFNGFRKILENITFAIDEHAKIYPS